MTPKPPAKLPLPLKAFLAVCSVVVLSLLTLAVVNLYLSFHFVESDRRSTAVTWVDFALTEYFSKNEKYPASLSEVKIPFVDDEELADLMSKLKYQTTADGYLLTWSDGFGQHKGIKPVAIKCGWPAPEPTPLVPLATLQSE